MARYESPNPLIRPTRGVMTDIERLQADVARFTERWWERRRQDRLQADQSLRFVHPRWLLTDQTREFWEKITRDSA